MMRMRKGNKIILIIILSIIIAFVARRIYKRQLLQQEYWRTLEQKEDENINLFYQSNFKGIVSYIKQYEKSPDKYVIGVTDSIKNERTIGKVEITNFSEVIIGDTITKKSNSFELEIIGQKGKTVSLVKYE